MDEAEKIKLEDVIKELESIRGRHTELVTVYIPVGANINLVARQIDAEKSTADNIKSKATRNNVGDALEAISRQLKLINKTPKNGLAIFSGNVSDKEGQSDIKVKIIEPPMPLNTRLYRCDQTFILEPLKEMLESADVYGLIVMDRKEATIGILEGKQIRVLKKMTSGVPGKVRAGGQSAARFERITEGLAKEFFRRVAEAVKNAFFDNKKLRGILVGGPIPTKEEFLRDGQLVTTLKDKVIAVKDLGYTDEHGLELLVENSEEELASLDIIHEKKLLEKYMETLGKHPDKAAHKEPEVRKALTMGAVETLILSKKIDKAKMLELSNMAENISAKVEIVSNETPEGEQFLNMGGIGAMLRYATGTKID